MARFRLPPPFNDPEDDVVFPSQQVGGFRTAAVREPKPAARSKRPLIIALTAIAIPVVVIGGLFVARHREPQYCIQPLHPPAPLVTSATNVPVTTAANDRPPTAPVLRAVTASPSAAPTPPQPAVTEAEPTGGFGFLTLTTDRPARCTILGVTVHTPMVNGSIPAGRHHAECIAEDGTRRTSFEVRVRPDAHTETNVTLDERIPSR